MTYQAPPQVIEDGIDPRRPGRQPALNLLQEGGPSGDGATGRGSGKRLPRGRDEGIEHSALPSLAVVDLLAGAGGSAVSSVRFQDAPARKALGAVWSRLVEADNGAALGRVGLVCTDRPPTWANSGSTRSPNHVSCLRQRSPSPLRMRSMRLRLIGSEPPVSAGRSRRYAVNRSSV